MNIKCYDYISKQVVCLFGSISKKAGNRIHVLVTKKVQKLKAYLFYVNMFMVKTRNKNKTKKIQKDK